METGVGADGIGVTLTEVSVIVVSDTIGDEAIPVPGNGIPLSIFEIFSCVLPYAATPRTAPIER